MLGIARELHNLASSAKADSESDLQDQTPDTDDSGAHSYPEVVPNSAFGSVITSSFKRAPVMGNRGLEQRGKKSRTYPPKESQSQQPVNIYSKLTFSGYCNRKWLLNPKCNNCSSIDIIISILCKSLQEDDINNKL